MEFAIRCVNRRQTATAVGGRNSQMRTVIGPGAGSGSLSPHPRVGVRDPQVASFGMKNKRRAVHRSSKMCQARCSQKHFRQSISTNGFAQFRKGGRSEEHTSELQ